MSEEANEGDDRVRYGLHADVYPGAVKSYANGGEFVEIFA